MGNHRLRNPGGGEHHVLVKNCKPYAQYFCCDNLNPWLLLHYSIYLKAVTVPNDMFVKPIFLMF